jgi:hypothetical protein
MEPTCDSYKPLSRTAKWATFVDRHGCNIEIIGKAFLKSVPYSLLQRIAELLQRQWAQLASDALQLAMPFRSSSKIVDAAAFIDSITTENSEVRIGHLLALAKKIDSNQEIATLLCCNDNKNCEQLQKAEQNRHHANSDLSYGLLKDLAPATFDGLCMRIEQHSCWKFLADGLGLKNSFTRQLYSGQELLRHWLQTHPLAPLSRLHFEASQLSMHSVYRFVEAIPLEPVAPIATSVNGQDQETYLTRYHIIYLDTLLIESGETSNWKSMAMKRWLQEECCDSSMLWHSQLPISEFINHLKELPALKGLIRTFKKRLATGLFEPTSSGGVTLTQIHALAQAAEMATSAESINSDNEDDNIIDSVRNFIQNKFLSSSSKSPFNQLARRHLHFNASRESAPLTFKDFLYLYWQSDNGGEALALDPFCEQLLEILTTCEKPVSTPLLEAIRSCHRTIRPQRHYHAALEFSSSADQSESVSLSQQLSGAERHARCLSVPPCCATTATAIKALSTPLIERSIPIAERSKCIICQDRPRKIALDPCGHYGFCLKCITECNECPTCRHKIKRSIQIYEV